MTNQPKDHYIEILRQKSVPKMASTSLWQLGVLISNDDVGKTSFPGEVFQKGVS